MEQTHTSPIKSQPPRSHTLHFIDESSRNRALFASLGFELGYHVEVYADVGEFLTRPPKDGTMIVHDDPAQDLNSLMNGLAETGIWLPTIAFHKAPDPGRVVIAVKLGVLDYLRMPFDRTSLTHSLERLDSEARAFVVARKRMIEARNRMSNLSEREREVLDRLTQGASNKVIARDLDISPRTVEIHRANMLAKLGASHSADAIRIRVEAQIL